MSYRTLQPEITDDRTTNILCTLQSLGSLPEIDNLTEPVGDENQEECELQWKNIPGKSDHLKLLWLLRKIGTITLA